MLEEEIAPPRHFFPKKCEELLQCKGSSHFFSKKILAHLILGALEDLRNHLLTTSLS